MNNFQKLIGISFLIIALAIAYYLIFYIPNKERQTQNIFPTPTEEPCNSESGPCKNPFE